MACKGVGYFDSKGHFYKTPNEATVSDLSSMLGKIGEGDSLAPGIALMLLEKRDEIEKIFAEHDLMADDVPAGIVAPIADHGNVAVLAGRKNSEIEQAS